MEDEFGDDSGVDWDSIFNQHLDVTKAEEYGDEVAVASKRPRLEARLFPGPAGIMPKIAIESKQIATKLAKIKDQRDEISDLPLSQIEKSDNGGMSKEELIDQNDAWKALEKDSLFVAENQKFNCVFISKEATEGMAFRVPIFFCVIKAMDLTSSL